MVKIAAVIESAILVKSYSLLSVRSPERLAAKWSALRFTMGLTPRIMTPTGLAEAIHNGKTEA
jgi:hypothetical protein